MLTNVPSNDPMTLEEVHRRFQRWRDTRTKRRERIPPELWQMAVDLLDQYNLNQVSRALKLNYTDLKKRRDAGFRGLDSHKAPTGVVAETGFVELPIKDPLARGDVDCVLDLEDTDGRKLKMTIRGGAGSLNFMALVKEFWEMAG